MGNKELETILKKLKETNSEVRIHHPSQYYLGKIDKITKTAILLRPHVVYESIKMNEVDYLERARIEEEVAIPLSKRAIIPTKLKKNYIEEFVKSINYSSWKLIKKPQLRAALFEGYLLPNEEEIKILEAQGPKYFNPETKKEDNAKNTDSLGKIGFKYPNIGDSKE